MAEYYNVTTNLGDAEIAAAIASNTKLDITHIAFGDGNGSVPNPSKSRTSLIREVHRQAVTKYERHKTNANWIVIETIIPSNVGGFTIREMGIIANGKLISHGSHAPFEKVADPSGVSEYRLKFTQDITDGSVVEIMLDESLIYASQAWVEENFIKRIDIVDNLTTNEPAKPVSAAQAKVLQDNKLDKNANAASASKLQTSRQVSFSGAATGSFNFDGSAGTSCTLTLANSGATAGTYGTTLKVPVITVNAKGLITTVTTQDIPTASTTVKGLVQLNDTLTSTSTEQAATAAQAKVLQDNKLDKNANAVSASKLETSRQVSFSGAATGSFNFDGSAGTSCTLTLANSGATAGTYGTTLKVPVITVNATGLITTVTTQDIPSASTTVKGLVQLVNDLTSGGTDKGLTAEQGKLFFAMFTGGSNRFQIPNPSNPSKPWIVQFFNTPFSAANVETNFVQNFPVAFPNECTFVLASDYQNAFVSINTMGLVVSTYAKTKTGVGIIWDAIASGSSPTSRSASIIAIGN